MNDTITVIYERGVLRPLDPLSMPENSRIQVQIVHPSRDTRPVQPSRQRILEVLLDAHLIAPFTDAVDPGVSISTQDLANAARTLGTAGPISELVIAERSDSF